MNRPESLEPTVDIRVATFSSRPLIIGLGLVSPAGNHPDNALETILSGRTLLKPWVLEGQRIPGCFLAGVDDFEPGEFIKPARAARFMSRETQFAVTALGRCLQDAALRDLPENEQGVASRWLSAIDPYDISLFAGTGGSGISLEHINPMLENSWNPESGLFDSARFSDRGLGRLNPLTSFRILPNMPPSVAVIYAGIKGENLIFNPWEGSAISAFCEALYAIDQGRVGLALTCGSDCKTHSDAFIAFREYGLLDSEMSALSEGSACLALCREDKCGPLPIAPYCSVVAVASASVPAEEMAAVISPELCQSIFHSVLAAAELEAQQIDAVITSLDGGGGDYSEEISLQKVFSETVRISPRLMMGNAVAAAGHVGLLLGADLLERGFKKDDSNQDGPKPRRILVNCFGFGSEKHCVILERP